MPSYLHDMDSDDAARADDLVRKFADWTKTVLSPHVFLEYSGGKFDQMLTGNPPWGGRDDKEGRRSPVGDRPLASETA